MGMFGSKEDKKAMKEQELLAKYGLDNLSDSVDAAAVKRVANSVLANNFMLVGSAMRGKGEEVAMISLLQALVEQNWIIIRQLDKLNQKS